MKIKELPERKIGEKKSKIGSSLTYTNSEDKANALNNQFVSVFTNEDPSPLPHISKEPTPDIPQLIRCLQPAD